MWLKHFDNRCGKWIHIDGNRNNPDSLLLEPLPNTLLEAFFPEYIEQFTISNVDSDSSSDDCLNHPNGDRLLIASGQRLVYGPPMVEKIIEKVVFPDKKDRGAYGSLFIGSCKNTITNKLNILVVDEGDGNNGGIIPNQLAKRLVGDCHGKIDEFLATELSGSVNHLIQHRIGLLNDKRVVKGTFQAHKLYNLTGAQSKYAPDIDLLIPLSSFKGGDKIFNPIQPGLYTEELTWIGEKDLSPTHSKTSVAELFEMYPQMVIDYWETLEKELKLLDALATDPRKLAQYYCESYEENPRADKDKDLNYQLIKTVQNSENYQLLTHRKFADILNNFWHERLVKVARGQTIKWKRAMIMPSPDLKNGEICVPSLADGASILNFRSPVINNNGLRLSVNKHVPQMYGPNGLIMKGVVIVSDEKHVDIVARINSEIVSAADQLGIELENTTPLVLHSDFESLNSQERMIEIDLLNSILDSLEEKGILLEDRLPYETDGEAQGRDFDGDCIGFELATNAPQTALRVKFETRHPEKTYAPTIKEDKISFPDSMSFEEIALFMSDEISIGKVNNYVKSVEALSEEVNILRSVGTFKQKKEYLNTLGSHYNDLLKYLLLDPHAAKLNLKSRANEETGGRGDWETERWENSLSSPSPSPPVSPLGLALSQFQSPIKKLVKICQSQLTDSTITRALDLHQSIYVQMVEAGCYQNQIAVDMLKSARAPDHELIDSYKQILHRKVHYKKELKDPSAYQKRPITTNGFSPVELIVNQANKHWRSDLIVKNPTHQFKDLFSPTYTLLQYNQTLAKKKEFDLLFNRAVAAQKVYENSSGPILKVQTPGGKVIDIHNVVKCQDINWKTEKNLTLRIVKNPRHNVHHKLIAQALTLEKNNGGIKWVKLGDICENSRQQYDLKPEPSPQFKPISVELSTPLTDSQVYLIFKKATDSAQEWASSIPETEREQYAAAAWHCCHTRSSNSQAHFKASNFVFRAFEKEVISQIKSQQLHSLKVTGLNIDNRTFPDHLLNQTVDIFVTREDNLPQKRAIRIKSPLLDEEKILGTLSHQDWQLPVGTRASAVLKSGLNATANLNLAGFNQPIKLGYMDKGELAGTCFSGEEIKISLAVENPPTQWVMKIDNQLVGTIDSHNLSILEQFDLKDRGCQFEVNLNSYGNSAGRYALANVPHSDIVLRLHQGKIGHKFKDRFAVVTIDSNPPTSFDLVVYFHLGEQKYWAGKFTNIEEKRKAVSLFKQYGSNQLVAKVNTVNTLAELKINPDTIVYPELGNWQDNPSTSHSLQSLDSKNADQILKKLISLPTLFYEIPNERSLGLTVDKKLFSPTVNWLFDKQITFTVIDETDPKIATETTMGYSVLRFDPLSISDDTKRQIVFSIGAMVIADFDNPSVSPYHDLLFDISADFNIRITPPPTLKSQSAPHLKNS
nr:hypothetical protein [Prochloraceae cyanobacterium]